MALNILGDPVDGNDIGTAVSNCLFMELFSSHPPGGDGLLLIIYLMFQLGNVQLHTYNDF